MGFIARLFGAEKRNIPSPRNYATSMAASGFSFADLRQNTTVQACVNLAAHSVSILPLNLYFRNSDGSRQKAGWHEVYNLMRKQPNLYESPTLFKEKIVRCIKQKGNAYVFKNIDESTGRILSLHLLNPEAVLERYDGVVTTFVYNGKEYNSSQVFRISSLVTDDHGKGYASVDLARAAILLGTQFDNYALSAFGNGLNTKLLIDIVEDTKEMSEEAASAYAKVVADHYAQHYTGPENAGKPLMLFRGKAVELKNQSSNRDAELLESRKWSELEICKIMETPPFLIGSYDIKYGNFESAMTAYLNFDLSPLLHHIEETLAMNLLSPYEQGAYYFEFDYNVLLRPDAKTRAEVHAKYFAMGVESPDDIAARENYEPDPNGAGAMRFVPANMMPQTPEVQDAYMAGAKLKAEKLGSGGALDEPTPPDPSRAVGDDKA